MKPYAVLLLAAIITASSTMCRASRKAPAKCDPVALRPCALAIIWNTAPSTACCVKLREQKRCLCQYTKNLNLSKYINSQNTKKVSAACCVPAPRC